MFIYKLLNIYYSKIQQKRNWKKNVQFALERQKLRPPRHLAQFSILKDGLGILDIDTQSNSSKTK